MQEQCKELIKRILISSETTFSTILCTFDGLDTSCWSSKAQWFYHSSVAGWIGCQRYSVLSGNQGLICGIAVFDEYIASRTVNVPFQDDPAKNLGSGWLLWYVVQSDFVFRMLLWGFCTHAFVSPSTAGCPERTAAGDGILWTARLP